MASALRIVPYLSHASAVRTILLWPSACSVWSLFFLPSDAHGSFSRQHRASAGSRHCSVSHRWTLQGHRLHISRRGTGIRPKCAGPGTLRFACDEVDGTQTPPSSGDDRLQGRCLLVPHDSAFLMLFLVNDASVLPHVLNTIQPVTVAQPCSDVSTAESEGSGKWQD